MKGAVTFCGGRTKVTLIVWALIKDQRDIIKTGRERHGTWRQTIYIHATGPKSKSATRVIIMGGIDR